MEIAIEPCDPVLPRLSERALLLSLAAVGRRNSVRWLTSNLQSSGFSRLSSRDTQARAVTRLSCGRSQIRVVVGLRGYRWSGVVVGGIGRKDCGWSNQHDQERPADEDARTSHTDHLDGDFSVLIVSPISARLKRKNHNHARERVTEGTIVK